ncbi:MAG TPA: M23 family metallopeptidase [Kofleriaceae bacterium]|nr:M23 family metallopeptidase [Kofleriaceae bacterium]
MQRSVLTRLFVAAAAVVPGCATAPVTGPVAPAAPPATPAAAPIAMTMAAPAADPTAAAPAPAPTGLDPDAVLGIARLATMFDLAFAPDFVDHMVRTQLGVRNVFHQLEDELARLSDDGPAVPNLTVLTTEPVPHTESSGFGWRDDPIRHTRRFHSGTDYRGKPGTPIVAAGNGVVTFAGRMGGYGNMVEIDHGGGVITRYAHMRRIETQKNAVITAGERIGQVGSTGRATGPHLHFEVRLDGAPVSAITAMSVAALERDLPTLGRFAAMSLAPELQSRAESDVDPPKQRVRAAEAHRPERAGRGKRKQVLW